VVITGSSIKRIDGETALPVQILKRADIERIGATSTEELVKQLSSLSSAGSSTTAANASGYGGGNIATVSLRGLGGARTLVLVNGRRASVYGGGSAGSAGSSVDVNSIPLSAIERVEVLKDGASAVYGSDAIAGVVNFILRKRLQGRRSSGTYGQPTRASLGRDPRPRCSAASATTPPTATTSRPA
jgi:iron complex outermembrane receptor protein